MQSAMKLECRISKANLFSWDSSKLMFSFYKIQIYSAHIMDNVLKVYYLYIYIDSTCTLINIWRARYVKDAMTMAD